MESEQEFPSPPSQRAETDLAGPSTGEQHTVPDVKPPGPQRGYKRKLGNSRSATPGTVQNSDDEASRRSSETPTGHRYGLTGPDEDARLRACARMGTKVAGSGDGGERGEECFFWIDLPMNRTGFRYIPCANGPRSSQSSHPGVFPFFRRIPQPSIHTSLEPKSEDPPVLGDLNFGGVHIDWQDRSTFLRMSPSALTITADKGFRSGRANVGVKEGSWYFECHILKGGGEGGSGPVVTNHGEPISAPLNAAEALPKGSGSGDGAHVRIGWARREASLNGPCGLDAYSYGIRDSSGEKVTISRPAPYGVPFGSGDVIGCLIHLPNQDELSEEISDIEERERERAKRRGQENDPLDPKRIARKRFPLHYKGQHYFEMVEYPVIKEMENIVARDGRVIEPAIAPGTDVNIGIAVPVKETTRTGSPVKKPKTKAATKNIADGKNGKAVKKGRKTQGTENDGQEDQANRQKELPRLVGSRISFFLNGQPMSPDNAAAFKDILSYLPLRQTEKEAKARAVFEKGTTADALMKQKENPYDDGTLGYYPFISCFGNAKVKFNPGPLWEKPVDPGLWNLGQKKGMDGTDIPIRPRPINERWPEFRLEERCYDEMDDEADMIKLKRFEMEKRKEKRTKPERGTARGGKRTRGTKRGGKVPSSLATEIFDRNTPGSSPIPESVGLDQTMSRASTPSNIDYAMDIDHTSTQGLGGITEYGIAGGPSYEIE